MKKVLMCTIYSILVILLLSGVFFLVQKASGKENGNIVQAKGNSTYFRNTNPTFSVDFVDSEYIRFESIKSYKNPFEEKKENIWEKIKYYLGIERKRLGLELRLEGISYDEKMYDIAETEFEDGELKRNFELFKSGRDISGGDTDAVSKDTVVSRDVYRGIDVEYQIVDGKGLKEEIVLQQLPEYSVGCSQGECRLPANRYVFRITLDEGLELKRSVTGIPGFPAGTQYVTDMEGNYFAHFLPEFAKDALGNKTSNIYINITGTEKSNEYIYELILDAQWLLSEERVFPVRVDPSIVHDSTLSFDLGTYDRTVQNQTNTVGLNGFLSGEYISGILPLGGSAILDSISSTALGIGTGSIETPYSKLGILLEENFNDSQSEKKKWGEGAYVLSDTSQSRTFSVGSSESSYFAVEFWKYQRYRSGNTQGYIFRSNLGSVLVKDGMYAVEDSFGAISLSSHPVVYNQWNHISVVFDLNGTLLNLYIDGKEEKIPFEYGSIKKLSSITVGGDSSYYGYLDTLRVYNRLLTVYEVSSNTQYANLYLTYRSSEDGKKWSEWRYKSSYTPEYEQGRDGIYVKADSKIADGYNLISFLYAGVKEEEVYITEGPVEAGLSSEDTILLERSNNQYSVIKPVTYFDMWFKPSSNSYTCLLNIDTLSLYSLENGKVVIKEGSSSVTSKDSYMLDKGNHIAVSLEAGKGFLYVNGNRSDSNLTYQLPQEGEYSIGRGCSDAQAAESNSVESIRVSGSENLNIYEIYNVENHKYTLKPSFTAVINSSISDVSNKSIYVREKGANSNYVQNLSIGDYIVIEETINNEEYMIEGEVVSLNKITGLVEVKEWVGEFPQSGFSSSAKVYKWQREYIPISGDISTSSLFIKSNPETKIKDIKLLSAMQQGESTFSNTSTQYLQYKYIFISQKSYLTPYLSSVNINYTSAGPNMDQIMRHGKWFSDEGKQPFWWAN